VDASAAGRLQRRVVELALMNQALILSALALMLFVPALVTLASVMPLGASDGMASGMARRVGLSPTATRYLQELFPDAEIVQATSTGGGTLLSLLLAYSWPATLMRGYETIWDLPAGGRRDAWRPLVWLVVFFALVVAAFWVGQLGSGVVGQLATALLALPVAVAWAWWSQHLLLAGRVPWRALLPGAVALALALAGLRLFLHFYLSRNIESQYRSYGPWPEPATASEPGPTSLILLG
jgi:membrane protein